MEYSYAQYRADRKLLRFSEGAALPVPATLPLKLEKVMRAADAADHAAIQAAYERLLELAQAVLDVGPEAIPMPPPRPRPAAKRAAPVAAATPQPVPAVPLAAAEPAGDADDEAKRQEAAKAAHQAAMLVWNEALAAQAARHARRRKAWPGLKPPFKDLPPQAG